MLQATAGQLEIDETEGGGGGGKSRAPASRPSVLHFARIVDVAAVRVRLCLTRARAPHDLVASWQRQRFIERDSSANGHTDWLKTEPSVDVNTNLIAEQKRRLCATIGRRIDDRLWRLVRIYTCRNLSTTRRPLCAAAAAW